MTVGAFVALLSTVTLPVTLPTAAGANATFVVADWLGVKMVPGVMPLAPNPVPVAVTLEIVTFELPVFVSVTFKEPVFPTFIFPKSRLVLLALSRYVAEIPVPLRPTEVGEVDALLTIETLPDAAPTEVGWKAIVIVVCCPALTFKGTENPLTAKAGPDSVTWVMLRVAVPVLVMIKP
jgi:hypothetical protein